MKQKFDNLPIELTKQKRFLLVGEDKVPLTKEWSNPNNQKFYTEIKGIAGFDISGHDIANDYIVLDFDHVVDPQTGEWINDYAKETYKWIAQSVLTFIERSISKSGYHMILLPTAGVFDKISNSSKNTLYFIEGNTDSKLEIFYKTAGRYFLFTGDNCDCEPQTPIASGEKVDEFIKTLLDEIHKTKKIEKASSDTVNYQITTKKIEADNMKNDQFGTKSPDNESTKSLPNDKYKNFYTTSEVAKILNVKKQTVEYWRKKEFFVEDLQDHNGVYLYSIERVEQLKSVYHKDWQKIYKATQQPDESDYERARTIKALFTIPCAQVSYTDWLNIGKALQSEGYEMTLWDEWSRTDVERYKGIDEISYKWQSFKGSGITIRTLFDFAKQYGYDEKSYWHEWHNTHKTVQSKSKSIADDEENQVEEAIEILNSITNYTPADVLQDKVLKAAALCKLKAPIYFDSFKKVCKLNKIDMSTFNSNVDNHYKELRKAKLKVISNPQFTLRENKDKTKYLPPLPDNMKFNFKTPTGYVMDVTGIYQNTKDGLKRISRSAIIVSKLIRNIDEGICKTQLACCKYGKQWIIAPAVDNNIIASKQKIVSMSDHEIDVTSNNASAIIEFIAEFTAFNIDTIPKASSVNQTGWRKNGEFVYPNTDSDYVLDDSIKSQLDKIFAVEGKKENVTPLIHKIKKVDVSNINLGATLAAPLVHILKIDNIVVHTYGLAGSGKTIQNTFLFSLFGNPKANLAMPGADATRVGLENLFAGRHDLPAFIEDLNSVKGDKKFQSIVQQLPYQFGNGTGRLRGKPKGGNQNLINIRGTLLTTDEKPLTTDTSAGGGKRRVIELKTPNEMFDSEIAAEIDEIIRENYGLFGREWIELIKENRAGMKDMYDEIRKGTKDSPGLQQEFINKVPRHIQSIAAITTANIFFDVHFLNIKFEIAYKQEISCARRILQTLPDKKEMADFERAKPIIIDWFLQHRKKFVDDSAYEENTPQYNETKSYEEYGIIKKDFIAVNTTVFRKMLNDNNFSPDIIIRQLIDDGFLVRDGKNLEKRIRVKGLDKLIRMTCIDKSKIEEMPSE